MTSQGLFTLRSLLSLTMVNSSVPNDGSHKLNNVVLKSSLNLKGLNFLHINPGSLKPHIDEIRELVAGINLHCLAVSETWFSSQHNDNLVGIPGFILRRNDRSKKRGGGVAIYIKNSIRHRLTLKSHANSKVEYLFLEIDNNAGIKCAVGVVYNPPGNTRLDPLKRALANVSDKYNHVIILGDFNLNFLSSTAPVRRFKDFLRSINLLCPMSEPTNFVADKNPSLIDLLLIKEPSSLCRLSQLTLGSYTSHDLVYGCYNIPMLEGSKSMVKRFRNYKKVCPQQLQQAAAELNWDLIYSMSDVDDQVEHLTNLIEKLMDSFCPVREVTVSDNSNAPWFTEDLKRMISARDYYHKISRVEANPILKASLLENYRRLRNKVNTMKLNLKAKSVSKTLNPNLPSSVLWKNLKNLGVTKSSNDPADGFSPSEFNSYFSSVFSAPSVDNVVFRTVNEARFSRDELDFQSISDEEVASAINQISTNAVGEDGISAIFIKKLCPFIVPFVTHIVNCCITKSHFPTGWKIANVRPIPKETNPEDVSEFRPISILPCLSKVLERIMKDQIQDFIDANNMLFKHQSGFRKAHSTNTAMLKVVSDLAAAIEKNCVSVLTLLDLKKAFDLVDHGKLLLKLKVKFNFSSRACNFIKSYLSDRRQRVRVGDDFSELSQVTSGTPQGGILSALLFSLFINDLSDVVDCGLHLYADDSQIYCSAPKNDISLCVSKMNEVLKKVETWANDNSLTINPKKSSALIVSGKIISDAPPVQFGSDVISYSTEVTSLGLILDGQLTWKGQIEKICRSTNSGLWMLRQSQSFTPLATRKLLVKSLLIPKILYCSNIFMGCSRASWAKLNMLFNSCLRYAYGLRKFDSISSYTSLLLGCPLENFTQYRSCVFLFNLLRSKSPRYLYDQLFFPRFPRQRQMSFPLNRKCSQMATSFNVMGIHLWNSLSAEVRMADSATNFRHLCLSYFASKKI